MTPNIAFFCFCTGVFLHDPRLVCHHSHSISRLKNREDSAVDSFFWPLAANDSSQRKKNDHNFRPYSVPAPKNDQYRLHDQALYSLWMHYVEFCKVTTKARKAPKAPKMAPQDLPVNIFTQRSRLPVFQLLSSSNGCPISPDQFRFATFERIRAMNSGVVQQPPVRTAHSHMLTPVLNTVAAAAVPTKPIHSSPTGVTARLSFGGGDASVSAAAAQATSYAHQVPQQQTQVWAQGALGEAAVAAYFTSHAITAGAAPVVPPLAAEPRRDSLGTNSGFTSFSSVSSSGSAAQVGACGLFDDIPLVVVEEGAAEEKEAVVAANKQQQQEELHQWSARGTAVSVVAVRPQSSLKQ